MKILLTLFLFLFANAYLPAQGYKVSLQTPNFTEGIAYLTYYYGKNINIEDSAVVNAKGIAVFKKNENLQPGIYSIVFPGKSKLFDFLVAEDNDISITADTNNLLDNTVITGAPQNKLFQEYQKFVASKAGGLQREMEAYKRSANASDSALHEKNYFSLNKELTDYRETIVKEHPESMLAVLLKSMQEPQVPTTVAVSHQDSMDNYQFYKKHYWDGIDFTDASIIRTPFFLPRFEKYFREVLPPVPDSIIKAADYILLRARSSTDMYKFILNWMTDEYINPKYMGQDAVFVHLFEKYHSQGISSWLNEKQMTAISNRAYMLMANLIGKQAANLQMVDTSGKAKALYDLPAEYTIVCFWDPTCSHCQHEVPRLDSFYQAKWKNLGVKIYAVLSEPKEVEKWKEFINKNNLQSWSNVYQTGEQKKTEEDSKKPSYKQLYDITQTPTLYLLDKEKRIIAKKLSIEQMDDLLKMKTSVSGTETGKK
ncbi:MAG: thioredoxin-like domain-containing protein [Ginsengibacter sp.]